MSQIIEEVIEVLESLVEDLPSKPRTKLEKIIGDLKKLDETPAKDELLSIEEELEEFTDMANVDSFTRIEVSNVISLLEQALAE